MTVEKDTSLTHALLAKALGVTVTTVKSYRRKFPEFWPPCAKGKPLRFPRESLDLCKRIQHHFKRGLSVDETRKRLAEEFQSFAQPSPASKSPQPSAAQPSDTFTRLEALLEGLFTLQNRTHSLLAELVVKLDTFAERVAMPTPAVAEKPSRAYQAQPQTARAQVHLSIPPSVKSSSPTGEPELLHPPQALLDVPVVVLSDDGEFLGVTMKSGRALTLSQFAAFLVSRAETVGEDQAQWNQHGQEWTLRLKSQGHFWEHHFQQAVTPRGNSVARFSSLATGGKPSPEHSLQILLRQVKDTLDQ
jgi:hypothetical protein